MDLSADQLKIILFALNKQPVYISRMIIQKFPFQALRERKYDNANLSLILEVVNLFMRHKAFTLNPHFVKRATKFAFDAFASISEANEHVNLFRSTINSLRRLLVVANRIDIRVNITTKYLLHYQKVMCKAQNTEIVEHLFGLIGVYIEYHQVQYDDLFNNIMKLTWEKCVSPEKRFNLALRIIRFSNCENEIMYVADKFFMHHLPNVDSQTGAFGQNKIIDACIHILNHFPDIETKRKFAIRMFQCHSMRTLKNKALNVDRCIELFIKQLQIVFEPLVWDKEIAPEAQLEDSIRAYIANENNALSVDIDIVVTYLEFMYINRGRFISTDQVAIAKLIDKHDQGLPIQKPVLKSFIMLFSLYATRNMPPAKLGMQQELLKDLDRNSDRLGSMLTFHEMQLTWILDVGNYDLRSATILQWIAQIQSDNDIKRIANRIESTGRLADAISLLNASTTMKPKRIILKVLNAMQPLMVSIQTLRNFSKGSLDVNALEILFEINPQVPDISSGVEWSVMGNSEQESIDFVIKLIRKITHILAATDMSDLPGLKIKLGEYTLELIRQNASYIKQLLPPVLAPHVVSGLVKDVEQGEGQIVSNAAELLYLVITTQMRLEQFSDIRYEILVTEKLHNPSVQKLLLTLLYYSDFLGAVYLADNEMLHEKLLTVLDSPLGNFALQALQMLIRANSELLLASINKEFIVHWSEAQTMNTNVLQFVIYWTNLCATYHFKNVDLPLLALHQIIAHLEKSRSIDIDFTSLKHFVANFEPMEM